MTRHPGNRRRARSGPERTGGGPLTRAARGALVLALLAAAQQAVPLGVAPARAEAAGTAVEGTSPVVQADAAAESLTATGTFVDTFADAADTDPRYGLNESLDLRQTGTATASYTRVSGMWRNDPPPPPWYAQVNHPAYPDRLTFWSGISAIMLDAPVRAGTDGKYTIRTTIDPVVGEATGADWGSLVLSRSRLSTGYVTQPDVDLGLTVTSGGTLTLYHRGTLFWQDRVPAASGYDTSLTVSTGADKKVTLVVNGVSFAVAGPSAINRWPSTPYLYLGAYLSTGSEVTAFGSGRPGEGLSVSQVDTSIAASARPFVDTFDGSPDTDASGYGLNAELRLRQPTVVANGYTRTAGTGSGTPAAWASQVNHPSYPDRMSFWTRPSAVRVDKPLAADLGGGYSFHAVVDPAANASAPQSSYWVSLMLSQAANGQGNPSAGDTDLGLSITDNGRVQLYQRGQQTWSTPRTVTAAADGTFDVTVTATAASSRAVRILINGTAFDVVAGNALPATAYLSLGSNVSGTVVATVDDLRMSKLGGLSYYGYFDVQDPTDHVDHSFDVSGYTNLNLYLDEPHQARLDYCRPQSCMILIQWQQFELGSDRMVLREDSLQQVLKVRDDIAGQLGKLGAIYLVDEPYGAWSTRNITAEDLQTATDQVASVFPGKPLVLTLDGNSVHAADRRAIPSNIDFVGFDWYCAGEQALRNTLATLGTRLTSYQQMFLMPESAAGRLWCAGGATTDASIAAAQPVYASIAADNPRVALLLNFGWWLGTYQEGGQFAGEHFPFTNLPLTAQAQRDIGESVLRIG